MTSNVTNVTLIVTNVTSWYDSYKLKGVKMAEIIPSLYISEVDASIRYGYSRQWFQRERWKGTGPSFMKINGGKVLYPLDTTDEWFKSFKVQTSTSQNE